MGVWLGENEKREILTPSRWFNTAEIEGLWCDEWVKYVGQLCMKNNPKISIVTAVYNGEQYLEKCIQSIKMQNYDNYEHIIIDGGSNDSTLEIIQKYENTYPMLWISENDDGMYDAIQKGFNLATGDIYAWLNSDDIYMPYTFELISKIMYKSNIQWCTGVPIVIKDDDFIYKIPKILPIYPACFLRRGYNDGRLSSMVQQESTFWTKELWEKAGGINSNYKYAGDYWLWVSFSYYEKLYTIDSILAVFRLHNSQKSSNAEAYFAEIGKQNIFRRFLQKTKIIRLMTYLMTCMRTSYYIKVEDYLEPIKSD